MVLKRIGGWFGGTTSLPASQNYIVAIYSVPFGKKFLLKEVRVRCVGTTNFPVCVYILKNGSDDIPFIGSGNLITQKRDIIVLKNNITAEEASYTVLAMNTVLESGDAIKMYIPNLYGQPADVSAYGCNVWISGDEF